MKTNSSITMKNFIFFCIFFFVACSNSIVAQTMIPLAKYPTGASNLKQYDYSLGLARFGIGLQTNPIEYPMAVFHLKDLLSAARPLFRVEGQNTGGTVVGSVKFLYSDSVKYYGIHQSGNTSFYNYFQNRTGIGAPVNQNFMLNVGGPARIANGLWLGDNEQTSDPYIKFFWSLEFNIARL